MFRGRRFAKPLLALVAVAALALAVAGCAFVKPESLALTQPQGLGSVRVHFALCTIGEAGFCEPTEENDTEDLQYVIGLAVPPGSTPPQTFTAQPTKGGAPIVFTLNGEVAPEIAASSAAAQKFFSEVKTPKEKEEAHQFESVFGGAWPPSGLQGVGYISNIVHEVEGQDREWSVDTEFGLPASAETPYAGPFAAAIAIGLREVSPGEGLPASRPVRCLKLEGELEESPGDTLCSGSVQQVQVGTDDLRIEAPKKPAQAFVGGSAKVGFPIKFAGTTATVPTFALSGTTTAKGGKVAPGSFTPGAPDATTHQSPAGTGSVTVSVPKNVKPGTYDVTLTAKAPQGGTVSQTGKLKVVKPTLKFGAAKLNPAKGTATLKVKVAGAGTLTIGGKGVAKTKKKTGKAKTLKVKIAATGKAKASLAGSGKLKLKIKATFKPSSGISVSKTKPVTLKLG